MATASQTELVRITVQLRPRMPKLYAETSGRIFAGQPVVTFSRHRGPLGEFTRLQAGMIAKRLRRTWRVVRVEPILPKGTPTQ